MASNLFSKVKLIDRQLVESILSRLQDSGVLDQNGTALKEGVSGVFLEAIQKYTDAKAKANNSKLAWQKHLYPSLTLEEKAFLRDKVSNILSHYNGIYLFFSETLGLAEAVWPERDTVALCKHAAKVNANLPKL